MMVDNAPKPPVEWNGKAYTICVPGEAPGKWMEFSVTPRITYVIRVRELGTSEWILGIETPLTTCSFVGLKPDTDYEMEVRAKNEAGESDPAVVSCHTGPDGTVEHIPATEA